MIKAGFLTTIVALAIVTGSMNIAIGDSVNTKNTSCLNVSSTSNSVKYSNLFPSLPIFDTESTKWRQIRWSTPVIARDKFTEKELIVVFDHDYNKGFVNGKVAERGVISVWSQEGIKAKQYVIVNGKNESVDSQALSVKVNRQVFDLQKKGEDVFLISPELREALSTSEPIKVYIRTTSLTGNTQTIPIGDKTIKAWQSVGEMLRSLNNSKNACNPN